MSAVEVLTNAEISEIVAPSRQGGRTHGETIFTAALERPASDRENVEGGAEGPGDRRRSARP